LDFGLIALLYDDYLNSNINLIKSEKKGRKQEREDKKEK
jgi:hypothetical protein